MQQPMPNNMNSNMNPTPNMTDDNRSYSPSPYTKHQSVWSVNSEAAWDYSPVSPSTTESSSAASRKPSYKSMATSEYGSDMSSSGASQVGRKSTYREPQSPSTHTRNPSHSSNGSSPSQQGSVKSAGSERMEGRAPSVRGPREFNPARKQDQWQQSQQQQQSPASPPGSPGRPTRNPTRTPSVKRSDTNTSYGPPHIRTDFNGSNGGSNSGSGSAPTTPSRSNAQPQTPSSPFSQTQNWVPEWNGSGGSGAPPPGLIKPRSTSIKGPSDNGNGVPQSPGRNGSKNGR
ncbi:hypothetical protein HK102_010375, partial [Quaeritorhiza haematococci]